MYCNNCGKEIPDGSVICPSCGINIGGANLENSGVFNGSVPEAPEVPLMEPAPLDASVIPGNDNQTYYNQDYSNQGYNNQGYNSPDNGVYQGDSGYQGTQGYQGNPSGSYYDGLGMATPEQPGAGQPGQPGGPKIPGAGGALALGICSICIGFFFGMMFGVFGASIGVALGVVGLILSINFRKRHGGGASGGLVTSIIGISLSFVMFIGCLACNTASYGYGCYGCIGGSCMVGSDVNKTYNKYFKY
ncbi:MAG: zinc ribbon domain-containing protein [Lachnospiraceae bacterium]|nr:zinc ribbon domain-containing protein [Lachnospiraceae bacterium]